MPGSPSVPVWSALALLIVMAFKHYTADFVLQTKRIAHGKEARHGWFAPLAVHVLCHAVLTLAVALAVAPRLWWLALVDLVVHAAIDRGKSLIGLWGKWGVQESEYWWLLGFDQFLHQVTNVALALAFLTL